MNPLQDTLDRTTHLTPIVDEEIRDLLPGLDAAEKEALRASIEAEGIHDPIVLARDGTILDGYERFAICPDAPCAVLAGSADMSRAELKAYRIRRHIGRRNLSGAQRAALRAIQKQVAKELYRLADGKGWTQTDVAALVGVDQGTVSRWLAPDISNMQTHIPYTDSSDASTDPADNVTPPHIPASPDEGEEDIWDKRRKVSGKEKKSIWKKHQKGMTQKTIADEHKITQGRVSQILKEIREKLEEKRAREAAADQSVSDCTLTTDQAVIPCAAVITDPPYGVLDEEWEPGDLQAFTLEWAKRWADSGATAFAIFWSQKYLWEGRCWFDKALEGYSFRQLLCWHYPNSMARKEGASFKNSWDPVFVYLRDGASLDITVHDKIWGDTLKDLDCCVCTVPQGNFKGSNQKLHPSQKPVGVMQWLVSTLTYPGDVVADPFAGSGTTGIACGILGRKFHGIDTSDEYLKTARGRIALYGSPPHRTAE